MYLNSLKIGNLILKSNIFVSPLSGYTDLPTRLILRKQNIGIAYTEMVSAPGLKYNYHKSIKLLDSNKLDKPVGIQLFGPNADIILEAFLKIKNLDFNLLDINCGCSIKKVLKGRAGAYLLKKPEEIYKIIYSLKQNTDKPITLKIRSGWDDSSINYLDILDAGIKAGADLITFHPRTRSILFNGKADWNLIKNMKEKSSIPVIGNGDIFTGIDAKNMFETTGCDGIMLGRGLIENPFLIEEINAILKNEAYIKPSIKKIISTLFKHLDLMVKYYGEKYGITNFRKHIRGYLKGLPDISSLRQKLNYIENYSDFKYS